MTTRFPGKFRWYSRQRLPRRSLHSSCGALGFVVGGERHLAPDGDRIQLTMSRSGGRFEYCVETGGMCISGVWLPDSTPRRRLAGSSPSPGVVCTESSGTSVVVSKGNTSLQFRRKGLTVIEAVRADSDTVVGQYKAFPRISRSKSYIALLDNITRDERVILVAAMASGVVLILRPLSSWAVAHWLFSWQRPVFRSSRT